MIVVLDTNAIIGLAKGECLERLRDVFPEVVVPPAVLREVMEHGRGRAGARELQASLGHWIQEKAPASLAVSTPSAALSDGDVEILSLAMEQAGVLITDDAVLRREATRLGITTLGTVDTVLLLKQEGVIEAVAPVLNLMRLRGYGLVPALYQEALRLAGEPEPPPAVS